MLAYFLFYKVQALSRSKAREREKIEVTFDILVEGKA
jgi:hypothetical protein